MISRCSKITKPVHFEPALRLMLYNSIYLVMPSLASMLSVA